MYTTKMNCFDDRFTVSDVVPYSLPFFHSCDGFTFREILESGKLCASPCRIFKKENLLYLFYGRPAYKSSDDLSHIQGSLLPMIFILKNSICITEKRIAPFDTGAFKRGLFKEYMHPKMKVDSFLMTLGQRGIQKTITYFFGSNENYYYGIPEALLDYDPMNFEIKSYHDLIKSTIPKKADDRKASIEIQIGHDIQLSKDTVEAVVCPKEFTKSELFKRVVKEQWEADEITYVSHMVPSKSYHPLVLHLLQEYFKTKGYYDK